MSENGPIFYNFSMTSEIILRYDGQFSDFRDIDRSIVCNFIERNVVKGFFMDLHGRLGNTVHCTANISVVKITLFNCVRVSTVILL